MRKPLVTLGLVGAAWLAPWSAGAPLAQTTAAVPSASAASGAATARVIVKYKADAATLRKTIQAADARPTVAALAGRAQSLASRLGVPLSAGNSIDARSRSDFGKSAMEASAEQQDALLTLAMNKQLVGAEPFFDIFRQLVISGYYTSEVGIEAEREYIPVPGSYDGSYPVSKVTKIMVG